MCTPNLCHNTYFEKQLFKTRFLFDYLRRTTSHGLTALLVLIVIFERGATEEHMCSVLFRLT